MIVDVLGLGESLVEYRPSGNITVGVNDIFRFHPVDYLVLVDPPERFMSEPNRYRAILEAAPKQFLCNRHWPVPNFKLITLASPRGSLQGLDSDKYCYSSNSPYVACIHAYKLGAKVIRLYGADFKTHTGLSNPSALKDVLKHFKALGDVLSARGVRLMVTKASVLSEILPVI